MLNEDLDAASAAFEVGYESPSQFSREYTRLFGAPPKRDIPRFQPSSEPPQYLSELQARSRPARTLRTWVRSSDFTALLR